MKPALILGGSGEDLLAQAERWRHYPHLKLFAIETEDTDYIARLPADVVWSGGIPLFPTSGRTEPITTEMIKEWLEEEA
jgi:hypothetical protein